MSFDGLRRLKRRRTEKDIGDDPKIKRQGAWNGLFRNCFQWRQPQLMEMRPGSTVTRDGGARQPLRRSLSYRQIAAAAATFSESSPPG